ncbi:hypothetical protein B0H17DRAFT_1297893 [Mycena rosella]|uniref:DUF6741 domain-containing protein n=1 Tax=Mycena rosella TaxID=1033263 RepID=A0AAD7DCF0_MYCRO|nr:hypothetical protein B0H17DRAFT_1297893 [Mycena rosella]
MYADPMLQQSGEYPQSSYPIYGPPAGLIPQSHRLTAYEDLSLREPYYADDMQLPVARNALTPMVGFGNMSRPRHRRHSTVSYSALPPVIDGGYRAPNSMHIKFKRKGALMAGINLGDAQSTRTRLSGNDAYTIHDLHADRRRRIYLRVRWAGYAPLTYEVPLDVYDGRVSMQALSRRVARACVHYLQMNMVPVMYSRVELHHLEESPMVCGSPCCPPADARFPTSSRHSEIAIPKAKTNVLDCSPSRYPCLFSVFCSRPGI